MHERFIRLRRVEAVPSPAGLLPGEIIKRPLRARVSRGNGSYSSKGEFAVPKDTSEGFVQEYFEDTNLAENWQSGAFGESLDSPAKMYVREIGRRPLLTAVQEVDLAKRIERGNEASSRFEESPLETTKDLQAQISQGNEARVVLTESNLRLVVSVATRRYMNRGLPFLDLVQEGNIGLMRAVDRYEWRRGFRFSTYAYWWIRQAMSRAVADHSRIIRVPVHMNEFISGVIRAEAKLANELNREPTMRELADSMSTETDRIALAKRAILEPISLESPVGDNQDATVGDFIEDKDLPDLTESASLSLLEGQVGEVLDSLTAKEGKVIRLRFGVGGQGIMTLGDIGLLLGVSRERVRQIESTALKKLRHPSRANRLKSYIE